MDDDVLGLDGGEAIAVVLADALGKADVEGLEDEVGPFTDDELRRIGEAQQALLHVDVVLTHAQLLDHEAPELQGHRRIDLEVE